MQSRMLTRAGAKVHDARVAPGTLKGGARRGSSASRNAKGHKTRRRLTEQQARRVPTCASAKIDDSHIAPGAKRRRPYEQFRQQEGRLPDYQAHMAEVLRVPRRRRRLLPRRLWIR